MTALAFQSGSKLQVPDEEESIHCVSKKMLLINLLQTQIHYILITLVLAKCF